MLYLDFLSTPFPFSNCNWDTSAPLLSQSLLSENQQEKKNQFIFTIEINWNSALLGSGVAFHLVCVKKFCNAG